MDLTQYVVGAMAIVGFINGLQFAINKNWASFAYFTAAVVTGTALGYMQWFGLPSAEVGFLIGIASSGTYKGLQVLRGI